MGADKINKCPRVHVSSMGVGGGFQSKLKTIVCSEKTYISNFPVILKYMLPFRSMEHYMDEDNPVDSTHNKILFSLVTTDQ